MQLLHILSPLGQKNIELFLRPFFEKQMRQGGFLFLFRQKTDAGTFLFETRNDIFSNVLVRSFDQI